MKRIRIAPALAISLLAACTASFAAYADAGAGDVSESAAPVVIEEAAEITAIYDVPLKAELQVRIIDICHEYEIDPAVVLAMMDVESDYDIYAMGDSGNAFGLLQVQPRWHYERIARLGCADLFSPENNVTVAVDYLAELLEKYDGDMEMALTAYNRGSYGAQRDLFSKGIYSSKYSTEVLTIAQTLSEGVSTCALHR